MTSIRDLANDIREKLEHHLDPARVTFGGSFAAGSYDEYSDIDLQADVHCELNGEFYSSLEGFLKGLYGAALLRYDPEFRENASAQNLRASFYDLPIFWRIDLTITSDKDAGTKWPCPFPEWSVGDSALMNVIWALKHHKRGDAASANHYLACACDKLGEARLQYSGENAAKVLSCLRERSDTDKLLVSKTHEAIMMC